MQGANAVKPRPLTPSQERLALLVRHGWEPFSRRPKGHPKNTPGARFGSITNLDWDKLEAWAIGSLLLRKPTP